MSVENTKVPAPSLVKLPLVAAVPPDMVRVVVAADTLIVDEVPAPSVKARFVEAVAPVYWRVPPLSTKFVAALEARPKFPVAPPLPIVPTLSVPSEIVVTPV